MSHELDTGVRVGSGADVAAHSATDRHDDLDAGIPRGRRIISLLAATSLLARLADSWQKVSVISPAAALAIVVGFACALVMVFGCLLVRRTRPLEHWDIGVLVTGIVLFALEHVAMVLPGYSTGNDETFLGHDALHVLLQNRNPYPLHFPDVADHLGVTPLLGGGVVTRYEYPPVTMEIGWLLHHLWHPLGEPYVVASLGLLALTVVTFFALPRSWRAVAVPVMLGFGLLNTHAAYGYSIIVALPLLAIAADRWTSTGAGGRLGRRGTVQAVALGAAAATHQLAWIVAGLLLVSLWIVRRGELDRRTALLTLSRFVGLAILTFLALDAPFIVADPQSWSHAMTSVFTQHAVPFGVGLIMVTVAAVGHSGALGLFTYATAMLAVAIVAIIAVGLRRVALAVPVFMGVLFLLGTRSTADYVFVFAPLWLVWAGTTDSAAVAASRPVRWRRGPVLTTRPRRAAAVILALVPALALGVVAVAAPAPLRITARRAVIAHAQLVTVVIDAANTSDHAVRPSWFVDQRTHIATAWRVVRGPRTLLRGERARLVLAPVKGAVAVRAHLTVYALSDAPAALSSTRLQLGAERVAVPAGVTDPTALQAQRCALTLLAGAGAC